MATGSVGFGRVLHLALLGLLCHLARASVRPEAGRAVQVPVVLWHGMGESCYNGRMKSLEVQLQSHLGKGFYIKVLCFGESAREDSANSFFFEANKQVQAACDAIASDAALRDGYHAVGVSQGGQFMRAVAQRCPSPPMKVLVTLGSQHQGVYGLPRCRPAFLCNLARRAASLGAYWGWVQKRLVQAQYWHDPRNPTAYRRRSTFIANINNDVEDASKRNASYATNLAALEKLVLVRFNQDKMVVPLDSQWFEFYADGSTKTIVPLKESRIYQEDWIGLKALDEGGRLVRLEIDGDHLRFPFSWFASEVVDKYMRTPPTNVAA